MSATIHSIHAQRPLYAPPVALASERRRRAICKLGRTLHAAGYRFAPVSGATQRAVNARPENACAFDIAAIFGWNRPFAATLPDPRLLKLMHAAQIVDANRTMLRSSVRAVSVHGDLYLHSVHQEQRETRVDFGPGEFRFVRALRAALPRFSRKVGRAACLACGAGAGAVTVAKFQPGAEVFAIDGSATALAFADINARMAGTGNVRAVNFAGINDGAGPFDLIVANPAWLCNGGPLSIGMIISAIEHLACQGTLMLQAKVAVVQGVDRFHEALAPHLRAGAFSWTYDEIDPDISGELLDAPPQPGLDRVAAVWLCATRRK